MSNPFKNNTKRSQAESQGAEFVEADIDLKSMTIEQKASYIIDKGYNAPRNRSFGTLKGLSNAELNYIIEMKCDDGSYQKAGEANAREITKLIFSTSNEIAKGRDINNDQRNLENVAYAQCDNLASFFGGVQNRYVSLFIWGFVVVWHILNNIFGSPFIRGLFEWLKKRRESKTKTSQAQIIADKEN